MLFNSHEFILFFLVTIVIYVILLNRLYKQLNIFLLASSVLFYIWWRFEDLYVLCFSILVNYLIGRMITSRYQSLHKHSRQWLIFGTLFNLFLLGYFKYFNFLKTNINLFITSPLDISPIALPLGISFFTFTQIAYLFDTYKDRNIKYSLRDYSLFVTFFPHLLAGPIIHHNQLLPQFSKLKETFNSLNISKGIFIFALGLFKKVCIADTYAVWATNGFDTSQTLGFIDAWTTSLSYTLQLYFDFSGYSDMAIGLALIFGIKFPTNFNSPYKAQNIQDFWRRWHITLSTFLRDYIYVPLGGNRSGKITKLRNLFLTFLIGGIWHGAGWTFIIWGALHGIYSIIHALLGPLFKRTPRQIKILTTFMAVNFAWIFFRASNWENARKVINGMFFSSKAEITLEFTNLMKEFLAYKPIFIGTFPFVEYKFLPILFIFIGLCCSFSLRNSVELTERFKHTKSELILSVFIFILSFTQLSKVTKFLYFNF